MAPRRKAISVSILDIKDAGSAARRDVRLDPKDTDANKVLDYGLGLKKTSIRSGTGKDVVSPKDLPTNAISFCYSVDSDSDCLGLGGRPGTVLDFSSLGNNYRTQFFSPYMSSDLFLRSQNGDSNGIWNPWVRLYHTGTPPTPKEIGTTTYAGSLNLDGTSGTWTTEQFVAYIKSLGVISSYAFESWSVSCGWSYAGNKTIDTSGAGNVGFIPLAGSLVEVVGNENNYIIRITTPTTSSSEGTPSGISREFIYINNGSQYLPGWRASYNTANKPQPTDLGTTASTGNTLAMRDSAGDIHCRLLRSEYVDQTNFGGGIAYRNNNSTDNYIRFCTNQAAVRSWLGLDTGNTPTFNGMTLNAGLNFGIAGGSGASIGIRNWGNAGAARWAVLEVGDSQGYYWYGERSSSGGATFFKVSGSFEATTNITGQSVFGSTGLHLPVNVSLTFNASSKWGSGIGWGVQEESATGNLLFHRYNNNVWQNAPLRIQNDSTLYCEGNGNFNDVYIRSDIRDKRKIKYIEDPLERIKQICGVEYEVEDFHGWKVSAGLLAQHVKNALPVAVGLDKNFRGDPRLRVNYNAVTGLLVNCVNALETKLESVVKEIINLREAYDELKTQVDLGINS